MATLANRIDVAGHDATACRALLERLDQILAGRRLRFMEVCGTHTVSIFQSGLRSLLPANITHLSGPGCPVCVTHEAEMAMCLDVVRRDGVTFATFGDLLRVPAGDGQTLRLARAAGANIEIVYSPLDAVKLAQARPERHVVFAGIGFETTAPAIAASILTARKAGIGNFSVLSLHKLVPPAIRSLLADKDTELDALLLPGHVATITGLAPFDFIGAEFGKASAVGGFEPVDILQALCDIAGQFVSGEHEAHNCYKRAVAANGNPAARKIMETVFEVADTRWRGLGALSDSGLEIRDSFAAFDAKKRFDLKPFEVPQIPGCRCGDVLKGMISPPQCALFGRVCSPASPVGPCMVSTEGSCAAWYKYGEV